MALQLDPEVAEALSTLQPAYDGDLPPAGDVAARRAGARRMCEETMASRPAIRGVDVQSCEIATDDGTVLRAGWYRPTESNTTGSAVLYLHGGGMIFSDDELGAYYDWAVRSYVVASGVPMLAVDYRVAPEFPHPVPAEDCYAALRWLVSHAEELGVDPARLAVMGDSAGGGLAAAVCLLARDRGEPAVSQQLLIYPMLDDRTSVADPNVAPFATWTYDDNITGWTALLGDADQRGDVSAYAAPARAADLCGLPSTYIEVGDLDIFRDEDVAYARRLAAAGVPTELHVYPGCPHAFEMLAPRAGVSRRVIADRVRRLGLL